MGMNVWSFTGYLGKDAELRTHNGESILNFSVATTVGYDAKETTTWARCALWGKRADSLAQYLVKGALVGISGPATLREFVNNSGEKQSSLEVKVSEIILLSKKSERVESAAPAQSQAAPPRQNPVGTFDDDDIPF